MAERKEIELIPKEVTAGRREERKLFTFRIAGFAFLALSIIVLAVLFSLVGGQTLILNNLRRQISQKGERIVELADIEKKVVGLSDKNTLLTQVLTQRRYYSILLSALKRSVPAGIEITDLSAEAVGQEISLTGTTRSYGELAVFLENLTNPQKGGSLFIEVGLQSVTLDPTSGKAQFSAVVKMRTGGLKKSWEDIIK